MDAKLRTCLDITLGYERGVTIDAGGLTNDGISQKAFPDVDILALSLQEKEKLYVDHYYNKVGAAHMSVPMAILAFDSAVNCGVSRTVKWLQIITNMLTGAGLATDGQMGVKTLQAIEQADQKTLALLMCHQRQLHYCHLRKSQPQSFGGWINRMTDLMRIVGCGFNEGGCQ